MRDPQLLTAANAIVGDVTLLRRKIHASPELAYQEADTARLVELHLRRLGLEVHAGIAGTGVIALLHGRSSDEAKGRVVLLRADMDALPIQEEAPVPFASRRQGVMHACGHDVHVACLAGAATLLTNLREQLVGDVVFMFQPAEEAASGATRMIADGLFEIAHPNVAYMLHVWHDLPAGQVAVRPGPVMAGALMFDIRILGRGGHAARPHQTVDPVVIAAQVVTALQSVVSREIDPADAAVLTIGSLNAGNAANVIPDFAVVRGTVRAYREAVIAHLRARVAEVATHIAAGMRAIAEVEFSEEIPPVVNDETATAVALAAFRKYLGDAAIGEMPTSMGSEDFAFVLRHIPGAAMRLGVRGESWPSSRPIHTSTFEVDESCLPVGVAALAAVAMQQLTSTA